MTHLRPDVSCPCGSGKLLCACHGASLSRPDLEGYCSVRSSVYTGLLEFTAQTRFESAWSTARERLVDACIRLGALDHSEVLLESDVAQANVAAYVCLDVGTESGPCLAQRYLDERAPRFDAADRRFLEALIATRPSLYEVEVVHPSGVRSLRDMRTGELSFVEEDHRSSALTPGAVVGTRLVRRSSGAHGVEGELIPFPPDLVETVVDETEDMLHALHDARGPDWHSAAARLVLQLHQLWFTAVLLPRLEPTPDPEDSPPTTCLMRFRIQDEKRLRAAIRETPEFVLTAPGEWDWFPRGSDVEDRPHGQISWHGVWLVLETRSRSEAEAFERAILAAAPGTLTLRSFEFLDPEDEEDGPSPFEEPSWRWRRFTLLGDDEG